MAKKLLGIYIPTHNRAVYLAECVREFIQQCKPYGYPIYILDGASTDNTEKTVKLLRSEYPLIRYSKNKKVQNYAQAIAAVLKMGNAEYVYLSGDDDKLMPGAVEHITEQLLRNRYDYLQINARSYSQQLKNVIRERLIDKYKDVEYGREDYRKVLLNNGSSIYCFFMSSIVMRKNIWDREIRRIDPNAPNMDFIHTICYYRGIVGKRGKLIAQPLIMNRGGNWGYSSRVMEIYFKAMPFTYELINEKGKYTKVIDSVKHLSLIALAIPVVIDKLTNNTNPKSNYDKFIKDNPDINDTSKNILRTVMYTPKPVLWLIYNWYKLVKRY